MKKVFCLIFVLVLVFNLFYFATAADAIPVYVDGQCVSFDVEPRIIDGRTMVPIRAIFEALGASVEWDNNTRTATATKEGFKVSLAMNSYLIKIGDSDCIEMDVTPMNIDGRLLVPARFAAEAFSCEVDWINDTRTVVIESKEYIESLAG